MGELEYTLEDEINGSEIIDHLNDWFAKNTVQGRFTMSDATENIAHFDQVRIPSMIRIIEHLMQDNMPGGCRNILTTSPFNFTVKLMTRGLGEVVLVLGEK